MPRYNDNISKTMIAPHVDAIIDSFIPDHIQSNYPELIAFVRAYLSYLEESNLSGYFQNTLPEQRNIRTQEKEFLRRIEKEIGLFVPRSYEADPEVFYDKISDLWRSKGSKEALETFFRLFLDDPVQINFPWEQVLIPSDGRWVIEEKIRVSMIEGNPLDFNGKRIAQVESLGTATVTKVEKRVYSDGVIWELTLSRDSIVGSFFSGNRITTSEDRSLLAEIYRSVSLLNIVNNGSGYKVGDRIFIEGAEGVTFLAFVTEVGANGEIQQTRFANYGSGNTPNHIQESNINDEYYLEDFLLYEYDSPNTQVGASSINIVVDSLNGSGASFTVDYGPLVETEGRYVGVKGQLSESIVLQDSYFYQQYSYEVLTNFPIDRWQGAVKKSVSPAGTIVFSNVRLSDNLNLAINAEAYIIQTIPALYEIENTLSLSEESFGFIQDYAVGTDFYFLEAYVGDDVFDFDTSSGTNTSAESFTTQTV